MSQPKFSSTRFAHSTAPEDKTGFLLGDLLPENLLEKFKLAKSKVNDTKLSSYDIWMDNRNQELTKIREKNHEYLSYFVASGKKYGLLDTLISCNGIYFDESPGKLIHNYKVGWYFNTNVYQVPCIVVRKKERIKGLDFEKRVDLTQMPEYKKFKIPMFNRGMFSLLPEGLNDVLTVGNTMNRAPGVGFQFLPTNYAFQYRTFRISPEVPAEYFYFIPVCDNEFYTKEIGLDSFKNWSLLY
jgi:hypothetical protein